MASDNELANLKVSIELESKNFKRQLDQASGIIQETTRNLNSLDNSVNTTSRDFGNLNRSINSTTDDLRNTNREMNDLDNGARASRLRGTAGGFADMSRAIGGTNSGLGQTVDSFEQLSIAGSGVLDVLQDGTELFGLSAGAMGALGLAIGTVILAYSEFDKQQKLVNLGIKTMGEGIKKANTEISILDLTKIGDVDKDFLNFKQAEGGLQSLTEKLQDLRNEYKQVDESIMNTDLTVASGLAGTFGFGDQGRLVDLSKEIEVIEKQIENSVNNVSTEYSRVYDILDEQFQLQKKLIVLKANEKDNVDEIFEAQREILRLESKKYTEGSKSYQLILTQKRALEIENELRKESIRLIEEKNKKEFFARESAIVDDNDVDSYQLTDSDFIDPSENYKDQTQKLVEAYLERNNQLKEIDDERNAQIEESVKFGEDMEKRRVASFNDASNIVGSIGTIVDSMHTLTNAQYEERLSNAKSEKERKEIEKARDEDLKKQKQQAFVFIAIQQAISLAGAIQKAVSSSFTLWDLLPNIGVAVGAIATTFSSIPKFASGGIDYAGSEKIVGEGSQPEVVMPLSRISQVSGNNNGLQEGDIVGKIEGSDIVLSYERSGKARQRARGVRSKY